MPDDDDDDEENSKIRLSFSCMLLNWYWWPIGSLIWSFFFVASEHYKTLKYIDTVFQMDFMNML